MPDIRVTDEKGVVHVFPSGSTPEMIAKAMKVNLPGQGAKPSAAKQPAPSSDSGGGMGDALMGVGSDLLQGIGEGALQTVGTVSKGLNKIPLVGKYLAPQEGIDALSKIATPENLTQRLGAAGEQIAETVAAGPGRSALTKLLARRAPLPLARILTEAATAGASAGLHDQPIGTSAALGAAGQGLSEGARAIAPSLAESAVGITERMRGRGRTIGQALLEKTSGLRASTVAKTTQKAIDTLTKHMERGVDTATQLGATGSTQGAHQIINDTIAKLPRNAKEIISKVNGLHDLLDLGGGAQQTKFTPNELLEMKRGIGKTIRTWPPEWQRIDDVKQVEQRLYGAIDKELDRLVPGNAELNQQISSLSPAKKAAMRKADQAGIPQKIGHRVAAHTGALAGAGIGSVYGYEKGGTAGAVAGGVAGLAIPEMLTAPATQMGAARMLASPRGRQLLPFLRALLLQKQQEQ